MRCKAAIEIDDKPARPAAAAVAAAAAAAASAMDAPDGGDMSGTAVTAAGAAAGSEKSEVLDATPDDGPDPGPDDGPDEDDADGNTTPGMLSDEENGRTAPPLRRRADPGAGAATAAAAAAPASLPPPADMTGNIKSPPDAAPVWGACAYTTGWGGGGCTAVNAACCTLSLALRRDISPMACKEPGPAGTKPDNQWPARAAGGATAPERSASNVGSTRPDGNGTYWARGGENQNAQHT